MMRTGSRTTSGWSPRRVFWLSWLLLFGAVACWALADPLMAAADEPAHAIKAAAVVRGEFLGDQRIERVGAGLVQVPELFAQTPAVPECFAFHPQVPADCAPPFTGDLSATSTTLTSAVRYNPFYYLVAGAPSLLPVGVHTFYLMRLVGALIATLLLAAAWRTVAEIPRSQLWMVSLMVATTPMVVFLTAVINPQSWEIPAALLVWTSALALGRAPDPALTGRRLIRLGLGVVVLANTRSLGPLFVAGIVLVALLLTPGSTLRGLARDRRTWWCAGVSGLAVGASVLWILRTGTLDTGQSVVRYPQYDDWGGWLTTIDASPGYLRDMLGRFGWTEQPLPVWWYLVAGLSPVLLWAVGTLGGGRRERLALAGVLTTVVVLPIVTQGRQARFIDLFWQGRYLLPAAVGLLLIAGVVWHEWGVTHRVRVGVLAVVASLVAVVQVSGFLLNLERYRDPDPLTGDGMAWLPVPAPWLIGGVIVCWLALGVLAASATRSTAASRA